MVAELEFFPYKFIPLLFLLCLSIFFLQLSKKKKKSILQVTWGRKRRVWVEGASIS